MSFNLEVILNLVDNLSGGMDEAANSVQNLEASIDSASSSIDNMGGAGFADIESGAEAAGLSIEQIGEAAGMAGVDISNIDPSSLQETADNAKNASGGLEEAAGSAGILEGALGALVGVGIVAFLEEAASAAGAFESRFERLGSVIGEGSKSAAQIQAEFAPAIDAVRAETGRGIGDITEEFVQLGISGVENKDILVGSFNAINAAAWWKNAGKDLQSVETAYNRMVMSQTLGQRQLFALGINENDVLKATGMSIEELKTKWKDLDPEQRATLLNAIIMSKGAADANNDWKTSYEGLVYQAGLAFDGLSRAVGTLILPYVIPAIEWLTNGINWLTNALKGLDPTTKGIVGAVTLFAGGLTGLYLILSPIISAIGGILTPILGAFGVEISGGAIAAGALELALGPVGWVILAVTAAVLGAIYVWQNWSNEIIKFKDNIMSGNWGDAANQIGNAFIYVGQAIWNALSYAQTVIWNWLQQLPAMIGNASGWLIDMGGKIIDWIITGLTSLSGMLDKVLISMMTSMEPGASQGGKEAGQKGGQSLIDGFIAWVTTNGPKILATVQKELTVLAPLLVKVILTIMTIIALALWNAAVAAGKQFVTGLINQIMQLPGRIRLELNKILLSIALWVVLLILHARSAALNFVNTIILQLMLLPGRVWTWLWMVINYVVMWAVQFSAWARNAAIGFVNNIIGYLISLPGRVWSILWNIVMYVMSWGNNIINQGRNAVVAVYNIVTGKFWELYNTGKGIFDQISGAFNSMKDGLVNAANAVKDGVWGPIKTLYDDLKGFWGWLSGGAGPAPGGYGPPPTGYGAGSISFGAGVSANADHTAGAGGLFGNIGNMVARTTGNIMGGAGPGLNSLDGYDDAFNELLGCDSCDLGAGPIPGAGNWDFSQNWIKRILDIVNNWKMNIMGMNLPLQSLIGGKGDMGAFAAIASAIVGRSSYSFYWGFQKSAAEALSSGAFNCCDGANLMCALASAMGLPCTIHAGYWNGFPHDWAEVNGQIFDTTAFQKHGVWSGNGWEQGGGPSYENHRSSNTGMDNLKITLEHDFKNVPNHIDTKMLAKTLKSSDPDLISGIDRLLSRSKLKTKHNLGA